MLSKEMEVEEARRDASYGLMRSELDFDRVKSRTLNSSVKFLKAKLD